LKYNLYLRAIEFRTVLLLFYFFQKATPDDIESFAVARDRPGDQDLDNSMPYFEDKHAQELNRTLSVIYSFISMECFKIPKLNLPDRIFEKYAV
jgi:hypothetical protein